MVKKIKKKRKEEVDMGFEGDDEKLIGYHKDYYDFLLLRIGFEQLGVPVDLDQIIQVIPPDDEMDCWEIHLEDYVTYLTTEPVTVKVKAKVEELEEPKKRKLHVTPIKEVEKGEA